MKTDEQYIKHEVELRVHDARFRALEETVKHIDSKFNWIVGIFITSILMPIALHLFKLI